MSDTQRTTRVHEITGWKQVLVWPLILLIRLWLCTLRVRLDRDAFARFNEDSKGYTFALWHNRLMIAPVVRKKGLNQRRVGGMISASKDGAWLAFLFNRLGIYAIRGSTSFRGKQAFREMLTYQHKHVLALTPDGPRGPLYHFQKGVSELSRRSKTPLVLMGVNYHAYWQLASWDQFRIPKPWSRVDVTVRVIEPDDLLWQHPEPEQEFRRILLELGEA